MSLTGIKLRAYPTNEQASILSQWMGCSRFIYNAKCDDDKYFRTFLAKSLAHTGEHVAIDQAYAQYKTELTPWLNDCPSQILRNSAVNWFQAYQRYFAGLGGRPKRKKKGNYASMYLTNELFSFEDYLDPETGEITRSLFIGIKTNNIGYLSFDVDRDFALPNSLTVSRSNGEWFISCCYQDGFTPRSPIELVAEFVSQSEQCLLEMTEGLDRGVAIPRQAATGKKFDFTLQQQASIARKQRRIKKQQRRLARQVKGSRRRNQTKRKISKAHDDIANIRKDFAHKTSRKLADSDQQIFIVEALKVKNMTAAPAAKKDETGKYVRNGAAAKAGLNAAILASAWGAMVLCLAYKTAKLNKAIALT